MNTHPDKTVEVFRLIKLALLSGAMTLEEIKALIAESRTAVAADRDTFVAEAIAEAEAIVNEGNSYGTE